MHAFGSNETRVERAWLPYDLGFATRRFLRHFRPELGVILETEIWPRLLQECASSGVPVVIANARLSERSARRYARWPALVRWAPIMPELKELDAEIVMNSVRFRWQEVRRELRSTLDAAKLLEDVAHSESRENAARP